MEGRPIETRPPEKKDNTPAFPEQTRAPYHATPPVTVSAREMASVAREQTSTLSAGSASPEQTIRRSAPAVQAARSETLRLAFVAALQHDDRPVE